MRENIQKMCYAKLVNYIKSNGFRRNNNILNKWYYKNMVLCIYFNDAILSYDQEKHSTMNDSIICHGSHTDLYNYMIKYMRKDKIIKVYE